MAIVNESLLFSENYVAEYSESRLERLALWKPQSYEATLVAI